MVSRSLTACSPAMVRITVAGEQITLEQGDAFTFPPSTQHTFDVAPLAGRAQVLWVFLPALPDTGADAQQPASRSRHQGTG
jgi:hypothetical protein